MKYLILASSLFLSTMGCQSNNANGNSEENNQVAGSEQKSEKEVPVWETWNDIENISGPVSISIDVPAQLNNKMVYLFEYEGKMLYELDSAVIKNNKLVFNGEYPLGLYQIGTSKDDAKDVVINPNEKELTGSMLNPRFAFGLRIENSDDNTAWNQYLVDDKRFQSQLRGLRTQRANAQNKAEFDNKIDNLEDQRIESHMNLADQYPGTFTAKILHRLKSPNDRSKSKFWDDIDFSDESYIRSPLITNRIQDYMRGHSGGTEDGFLNCVDLLMMKAKEGSERVFEFTLYTVLEGFYTSGMDNICNYILNDYYFGDACGDMELSDYSIVKANRIQSLQMGNTPPDFTIESLKGGKLTLSEEVKKHDYTLVFFWSSWCHTCEGEIPVLMNIYKSYKDKGFEVIGVSVDTDRNAWTNAVNSRNVPWPNVSQLNGWKSEVARNYSVSKTPTMFLLDKDMKIQAKPKTSNQVSNFLRNKLQ